MKRKRYSRKFQRMAVERMRTCENVSELARELGVRPRCLYKWRAEEALQLLNLLAVGSFVRARPSRFFSGLHEIELEGRR
ncbi:MAG: hypothetical protein DMG97_07870 [Acidobacteria bacterium]|nr:MAG: hypothetical protein DMG97_07870 [Acidobacteriota bacterium]